jgi:hypothetical protein
MLDKYMGGFKASDKGNVFCVSRSRAPRAALLFDALAFPLLQQMTKVRGKGRGRVADVCVCMYECMNV